ncbi:MAG: TraV family lipoprotein [Deferribacteraceae bacterium]|jgi:hypothetical protein|nr:TraV family lipoprotein [Deferribacteraceae bacterium]
MKYLIIVIAFTFTLLSCSDKDVRVIVPLEDKTIEEILSNDKFTNDQKITLIKERTRNILEREKPAVQKERDERLANIIRKPLSPLKTPEKVLRVLILPYTDDNNVLHTWKYSFITVDEGQWILGDYLKESRTASNTLTPLK